MKKILYSLLTLAAFSASAQNMVFQEEFDGTSAPITGDGAFTHTYGSGEWNIATTGHGEWVNFEYTFPTALNFATPGNLPVVYMRAKSTANVFMAFVFVDNNGHVSDSIVMKPSYAASLSPNNWEIDGNNTYETFTIDFARCFEDLYGNAGQPQGNVDSTNITKFRMSINGGFFTMPKVGTLQTYNAAFNGTVTFDYIRIGSLTASNQEATLISSSAIYPNPAADEATISLELQATSDVKVVVSDVLGKEMMTVAEGSFSSITKPFSVEALTSGVYNVSYIVNGSVAKTELLMVK